ncbi:TetR/AcrR family transcriptional regulator [Peribacillus sp. SCS-155]|uniref:TetR/AcrR family transcriptional regulator n=1 Tax=Peribacillus sedimenti TaxID=3115297 RepID=UPI0039063060
MIETSLTLFEKHGFHGVTVNQIVKASGTSKGGFYHHFQSKDELLFVIHDYFISYVVTKAKEAIATCKTPTDKLRRIIKSFVKVFDLYKSHISVFYQESIYLKPQYASAIREKRQCYKNILFQVIREGIDAGEFREDLSVEITGMSILGMVNWTYKWYKKDGINSIDEIADIYLDIILRAIASDAALNSKRLQYDCLQDYQKK